MALAPVDRATLAYLAVALGFTLAIGPRHRPAAVVALLVLLLAALAARLAPRARRGRPLARFLGEFYPLVLTFGLYTQVGMLNRARGVSHDATVQAWEQALFGGQPSYAWIRAFPNPAWSSLMHAAYLSYYAILVAAPLGLWLAGRRSPARRTLLLTMCAFYACYTAFLLFPVAGPRYAWPAPHNAATAVPLAVFTHRVLEGGSAWGTAFPSSHVAAALVAAGSALAGWRALGLVLLPPALLLTLATVYGQFHYALDALAGAALAVLVLIVGSRAGYDSDRDVTASNEHTNPGAHP